MFQELQASVKHILKTSVKHILKNPGEYGGWSIQGLGMLRLYLSKEIRLHVWSTGYQVPGVSTLHTHPWDFTSTIISGRITNHVARYTTVEEAGDREPNFDRYLIQCGSGGCLKSEPVSMFLVTKRVELLCPGSQYSMTKNEIHESHPEDGAVSLIRRTFYPDEDHAYIFSPCGVPWVSAEPRPATFEEVVSIIGTALAKWTEG